MLIFWQARLAILAVPKTGTTALAHVLGPRADLAAHEPSHAKHTTLARFDQFVRPLLGDDRGREVETLAVVREPLSWLSSWYRYRLRDDLVGRPSSARGVGFDAFVEEWCRRRPAPFAAMGTQGAYVFDADGQRAVTHLFRHDRPGPLLDFLRERLGDFPEPPRVNVSAPLELALAPRTLDLARRRRPDLFRVWREAGGEDDP